MKKAPIFLSVGIALYLFFADRGFRQLPGFKGVFYRLYHHAPGKRGVISLTTVHAIPISIDLRDDIIATALIEYGQWEPSLTKFMCRVVKPGMTVIDIGAHVGYYTTLFAKLVGNEGTVISFEPEPYNFSLLAHNAGALSNCTLINKGVSDVAGPATLYLAEGNLGAHSMRSATSMSTPIETVRLDEYLKDTPVHVIKMDVEGNEPFALKSMRALLAQPTVVLIFEYIPGYVAAPEEMFTQLSQANFTLYEITHDTGDLVLLPTIPTEQRVFNILCTKEPL
ncbi:MAG: hypothetical protein QG621_594 [Patescibacteria group bacterium]|jgi:FkbM family methyltransferase|nr:hypothetical protein [Patescibacteria group bacterium]